jgi:HCOMODA/2-hydroxy-3-carboxy-muconic semialdehyde decarboxylase
MSTSVSANSRIVRELVLANHILAFENVLDAYGHVSVRNPDNPRTFLMSRSRSPEIVDLEDIFVHDFAGNVDGMTAKELYRERFIHAAIFEARPEIQAVIHSHADDVLPFSISKLPLQAVFHAASSRASTKAGASRAPWPSGRSSSCAATALRPAAAR